MIDHRLLDGLKKKDRDAFKELFYIYSKRVYGTAFMILKDKSCAEDIVQETFMKIFQKIHTLKDDKAFETWLYRITVNCCYKYIKTKDKYIELSIEENEAFGEDSSESDIPENIIMKKELESEVINHIQKLPPYQRIPIIFFYYNEISLKEIAEIMECSLNTVKSRLHQGKSALRKSIMDDGGINKNMERIGGFIYENR